MILHLIYGIKQLHVKYCCKVCRNTFRSRQLHKLLLVYICQRYHNCCRILRLGINKCQRFNQLMQSLRSVNGLNGANLISDWKWIWSFFGTNCQMSIKGKPYRDHNTLEYIYFRNILISFFYQTIEGATQALKGHIQRRLNQMCL